MSAQYCFKMTNPSSVSPDVTVSPVAGVEFPSHVMLGQSVAMRCR